MTLVMRCPRALPAGVTWGAGVSLVDLMPTILDVAGVHGRGRKSPHIGSYAGGQTPADRSLLPALASGDDRWRRPVVMQNLCMTAVDGSLFEDRALRTERWKLILRRFDVGSHAPEIACELYDMEADPSESRNLSTSDGHRETVRELAGQLRSWGEAEDDPLAVELAAGALPGVA